MAVNEQAAGLGCVAAEGQDRLDVRLLRQQNVSTRLDRIMEAHDRAEVRIVGQERFRVGPFRVENRQDMGDAPALVADEFVESADGEGGEGVRASWAGALP